MTPTHLLREGVFILCLWFGCQGAVDRAWYAPFLFFLAYEMVVARRATPPRP